MVKTKDVLVRNGQKYEVVVADDNIFVICPIVYNKREKSDIVRFDKAEIYANQDRINTLEELRFEKISSNSVQEITSKYSEREKRIDEGYDKIVRTDLIKSILSINFIEDQEKRVCWRATYKDRAYGDGINVSKENVLEAITLLHKQAVRCLCAVESEEHESINDDAIKALVCCIGMLKKCNECPYRPLPENCKKLMVMGVLDIINRQKAEIERLKSMNQSKLDIIHDVRTDLETAKSEAIREFAERLKATYPPREDKRCTLDDCYTLDVIDNLVAEMTEQ